MSDAETRQDWQKVFLTRINGPATGPDLEIMTLAGSSQPDPRTSLEALRTIILHPKQDRLEGIEVVACCEVMLGDAEVKRALGEAIADGAFRSKLPWLESEFDKYTTEIYYRYDIPIQNSPISGETLA